MKSQQQNYHTRKQRRYVENFFSARQVIKGINYRTFFESLDKIGPLKSAPSSSSTAAIYSGIHEEVKQEPEYANYLSQIDSAVKAGKIKNIIELLNLDREFSGEGKEIFTSEYLQKLKTSVQNVCVDKSKIGEIQTLLQARIDEMQAKIEEKERKKPPSDTPSTPPSSPDTPSAPSTPKMGVSASSHEDFALLDIVVKELDVDLAQDLDEKSEAEEE